MNYLHLILLSNNDWIVPASSEARRYLVLDVSDSKMQDSNYFDIIEKQMRNGGAEALLNFLLKINITDFNVRNVPRTEALRDQQAHSINNDDAWWESKLQAGEMLPGLPWAKPIIIAQLNEDYYNDSSRTRTRAKSSVALTRFLTTRCFPEGVTKTTVVTTLTERIGKKTVDRQAVMPCFILPPLAECRKHWEKIRPGMQWQEPSPETSVVDEEIPF
jgi:hypothetical protein